MDGDHFNVLKSDKNGEYWWRLVAANGKIIATSGETYKDYQYTVNMCGRVRSLSSDTPIYNKTGETH